MTEAATAIALPAVQAPPIQQQQVMPWPGDPLQRMQLCRELATARLVPPAFQKSPADIFLVSYTIERLKLDFFMTIGECYVVSGKVGFSGKLAAAILNSSGFLADRLTYEYSGEAGDKRTVTVTARLTNEAQPRTISVSVGDVRTQNSQWDKQPDQMLAYAGARIWGRRHQPEALLGLLFDDEPDMIDVTPKQVGVYATRAEYDEQTRKDLNARPIEAPKPKAPPPEIKPPAPVEAKVPYELEKPDAGADATQAWRDWCAKFIALYRTSKTLQVAELWASTNYDTIALLTEQEPKMFRMLENAMTLHTAPMKPKDPAP